MNNHTTENQTMYIDLVGEELNQTINNPNNTNPNKRSSSIISEASDNEIILNTPRSRAMHRIMDGMMNEDHIGDYLLLTAILAEEGKCLYQLPLDDLNDSMFIAVSTALKRQLEPDSHFHDIFIPETLREIVASYIEENKHEDYYNAYIGLNAFRRSDYCDDVRNGSKPGNIEIDLHAIAMSLSKRIRVHKLDSNTGDYVEQVVGINNFDSEISIAFLPKKHRFLGVEDIVI